MSTEQLLEVIKERHNKAHGFQVAGHEGLALEQLILLRDDLLLAMPRKDDPKPSPPDPVDDALV